MRYFHVLAVLVLGAHLARLQQSEDKPGRSPRVAQKGESPFDREFGNIKAAMEKVRDDAFRGYEEATTAEERESLLEKALEIYNREGAPLAEQALELLRLHVQDPAAVDVLTWILNTHSASTASVKAADLLIQHHLKNPKTQAMADRFKYAPRVWTEKLLRALAEADLPRDRRGVALYQLAQTLKTKAEMAPYIKRVSSDERAARIGELQSGKEYIAQLRSADVATLEAQAIQLFTKVIEEYGDDKYGPKTLGHFAKSAMYEIEHLSVGKPAPEIIGEDIDGNAMKLSDYRGKVVMLSFWGSWCGPCMELVPHERELQELYKDKPFGLVGVNSDEDKAKLKPVLAEHKITWRSFWCGPDGPEGPIARAWNVNGWPMLYLIDHAGVIRGKQLMGAALDGKIAELVSEAERAVKKN